MPGSTTARGYGSAHRAERAHWLPHVEAGQVNCHAKVCLMQTRRILPGSLWDLGHTEDRTAWTGPEHRRCNRADGGRRRHRADSPNRWTL
jgi:hypothetical protein